MQSYSICLPTTIDRNSSKFLNNSECLLLDSHLPDFFSPFTPLSSFSRALLPPPVLPDLFPLLCCQCSCCCPIAQGKRTLEKDKAEWGLLRNASQCQGLDLSFIYLPKWLHHNPCSFWYQDSVGHSKTRKALVHGWVQVTPTSVPSCWKTWRGSWIYAGCGDDIPSPGRCPLGHNPTLQLQVLSAMLYLLPSLWRSMLCTDTLCVFRKPH